MGIVQDWQTRARLRSFATFAGQVVEEFGRFLLLNQKGSLFPSVCDDLVAFFGSVSDPKEVLWASPARPTVVGFSADGEMMQRIFNGFSFQPKEEQQLEESCKRLIEMIGQIKVADDISRVKREVDMFRDVFIDVEEACVGELIPQEEVQLG